MMESEENVHVTLNPKMKDFADKIGELEKMVRKREMEVQRHQDRDGNTIAVPYKSGMQNWSTKRHQMEIPDPSGERIKVPPKLQHLTLVKDLDQIAHAMEQHDVILVESPTGSGKSVLLPLIVEHYARKTGVDGSQFPACPQNESWKAVHTGPIGEQCVQHAEFLMTRINDITFGIYTSTSGDDDKTERKNAPITAQYIYCTFFFGCQVLDSGYLHAMIVDEIHEFTPDLMKILHKVRTAIQLPPSTRTVNKVILLSATLSDETRGYLARYFKDVRFKILTYTDKPFVNSTVFISDMTNLSQFNDDNQLYERECSNNGIPNSEELRLRSVAVQEKRIEQIEQDFIFNGNKLCELPGMICFFPGDTETSRARNALMESNVWKNRRANQGCARDNKFTAIPFKVSGVDRADLPILKGAYNSGEPMRCINSTTLLATGVTLPGVGIVIDDGTIKVPGPYHHAGLFFLELCFQDKNMSMQKKGRCGREGNGTYFVLVSKARYEEMMKEDHAKRKLDRAFRTNDMVYVLDYEGQLMLEPMISTRFELVKDMDNTGFVIKCEGWSESPTKYGRTLSESFNSLPLVMGDFLLRCFSMGVGLHGIIFVAGATHDFRAIRRPSGSGEGRDSSRLPINMWSSRTDSSFESDAEHLTEMALNLLLAIPLGKLIKDTRFADNQRIRNAYIIDTASYVNDEGLKEMFRSVLRLYGNLTNMRLNDWTYLEFIFHSLNKFYTLSSFPFRNDGSNTIYRLNKDSASIFRACLLQSFGSRMVYSGTSRDQKDYGSRRIFKVGGELPIGAVRRVQGELPIETNCRLGCYYEVIRRSADEDFMTGVLHYVTAPEFAVFGNVVGSARDEVNIETCTLKIRTNTAPIYFKFPDLKTVMAVVRFRAILRWIPISEIAFDTKKRREEERHHEDCMFYIKGFIKLILNHRNRWMTDDRVVFDRGNESTETGTYYRVAENGKQLIDSNGVPITLESSDRAEAAPSSSSLTESATGSSSSHSINSVSHSDSTMYVTIQPTQQSRSVLCINEYLGGESRPLPSSDEFRHPTTTSSASRSSSSLNPERHSDSSRSQESLKRQRTEEERMKEWTGFYDECEAQYAKRAKNQDITKKKGKPVKKEDDDNPASAVKSMLSRMSKDDQRKWWEQSLQGLQKMEIEKDVAKKKKESDKEEGEIDDEMSEDGSQLQNINKKKIDKERSKENVDPRSDSRSSSSSRERQGRNGSNRDADDDGSIFPFYM